MATNPKTKEKRDRVKHRAVYLTIAGKYLDPYKVVETLNIIPFDWGKLGEPRSTNKKKKCEQGYWMLKGGPSRWRVETQMKHILKKIAPARHQLKKLIKEDKTIEEAVLEIIHELPKGIPTPVYLIKGELLNEFTSLGIDVTFSVHVVAEWEKIFKKVK